MRRYTSFLLTTILATMLNSSVIKWQHQLLSRGEFLPEGSTADVAIVLGYALQRDGTPTPTLQQRVEAGVELFDKGTVDHLLFSGGHPGGGLRCKSEAQSMQEYAMLISNRTLPSDRWFLEDRSRSTRENAVNSVDIVAEHRWRSLVVVTSPFHQFRSYWTFRCAVQSLSPDRRMKVWLARVPVEDVRGACNLSANGKEFHKIGERHYEPWPYRLSDTESLIMMAN